MAVNVGYNGVQTSWGNDDYYNGFPNSTPEIITTGVATHEISLLESQKYMIDIYNDMKHFAPKEFPLLTLLQNMGGGTIDRFFDMWTDEYEGTDVIDVALDQLRLRDKVANTGVTPTSPFALGEIGEIGGEFIWQYASLDPGSGTKTWDFSGMADSYNIQIQPLGATARPTTEAGYGAAYLDKIKIKEICPVTTSTGKKLVTLGFYRTGTASETYGSAVGRISEVIRKFQNTLEVNEYTATSYSGVTLNGAGAGVWYEYKYTANSSFLVHQIIDNLSVADATSASAVNEEQKIQVIVGINRFMFNAALNAFILELDFAESNLDFLNGTSGTDVYGDGSTAGTEAAGYYQLTTAPYNDTTYPIGSIYKCTTNLAAIVDAQGTDRQSTIGTNSYTFQPVRYTLLLEETNTAKSANRVFGANIGDTYVNPQGCTRFARHITINRFDDVPSPNSELDGFDTELKGNYTRTTEIHQNFLQIYNMKPWAISTMRQGTAIRFGDTVKLSRERHLRAYKQAWTNIFLYGKKANFSSSETNYKGTTSGLFDFEMFPMKYGAFPIPYTATSMTSEDTIKGTKFKRWMEDFARACNATSVPGVYEGKTVMVGIEFINYITTMVAAIGSANTYNVFGAQFQMVPASKATFGLDVLEFKTTFGTLRFIHEPALDYITKFKVPRFLFADGKLSPRYTAIVLDKNFIEVMTHKTRPDRIYGNLQANNQPFMQMEGISGAKLLKLRFPRNFGVFNLEPNY